MGGRSDDGSAQDETESERRSEPAKALIKKQRVSEEKTILEVASDGPTVGSRSM